MQTNTLDVAVEEFTTPNPVTASEQANLGQLAELMLTNGIRHLPIVSGSQLVGVVSDRDLRLIEGLILQDPDVLIASDIMIKNPVSVNVNDSLDKVALIMSEKKIGSVMVNDTKGDFYGIFTVTDALNALIEIVRAARHAA